MREHHFPDIFTKIDKIHISSTLGFLFFIKNKFRASSIKSKKYSYSCCRYAFIVFLHLLFKKDYMNTDPQDTEQNKETAGLPLLLAAPCTTQAEADAHKPFHLLAALHRIPGTFHHIRIFAPSYCCPTGIGSAVGYYNNIMDIPDNSIPSSLRNQFLGQGYRQRFIHLHGISAYHSDNVYTVVLCRDHHCSFATLTNDFCSHNCSI